MCAGYLLVHAFRFFTKTTRRTNLKNDLNVCKIRPGQSQAIEVSHSQACVGGVGTRDWMPP